MLDKLKLGDYVSNGANWYRIIYINDKTITLAAWSRVIKGEEEPSLTKEFDIVYEESKEDLEEYIRKVHRTIKYNEHWA